MEKKNKVAVIGCGVSGLISGIYAQKSGFDVTIYEQHFAPGGVAASWSRKGFVFEGGMHWLTGSNSKFPVNRIWMETGALGKNNPVTYRDPVYTLIDGNVRVNHYRDVEKFRNHLLQIAPEDRKAINRLCNDIKAYIHIVTPVFDIPGVKTKKRPDVSLKMLLRMIPAGLNYLRLNKKTEEEYIEQFKNEYIKTLLYTQIGYRYNALSLIFTMAGFASGDYGFPEGGSTRMAENMVENFTSLGGKIQYRSKVQKVVVENNRATGIMVNNQVIPYDAVIVSQDARRAVDELFEVPLKEKWIDNLKKHNVTEQNMYMGAGINADLSSYPDCIVIPLKEPFKAGGLEFKELRINNYAKKRAYSKEGTTSITCLLLGNSYQWWKEAKEKGIYKEEKQKITEALLKKIAEVIPEIEGKIEVTDFATPLTYERYCSTYEGSWMSVFYSGAKMYANPEKSKTVKGLYFEGQRTKMPGGLPITAVSAREAVQYLCRDFKTEFIWE